MTPPRTRHVVALNSPVRWVGLGLLLIGSVVGCAGGGSDADPDAGEETGATDEGRASDASTPDVPGIVIAARRAVGPGDGLAGVAHVRFHASATSPEGEYEVEVESSPRGEVRLEFSMGFSAAVRADGGWARFEVGAPVEQLTDTLATFVRGHDLLMNVLDPEPRFAPLTYAGAEVFDDSPAHRVDGVDELGATISLFYSTADGLPLGFRVQDHLRGQGPVTTTLRNWRVTADGRLPFAARIVQGDEVFEYSMTAVELLESEHPEAFEPPSG